MAIRNQPYIPLYVQDFLTDEKLAECSASATGVFIRLMCLMHKSEQYGTILLKQKDKQKDKQTKNFALKIAKHLPYSLPEVESALTELIDEGVLQIDGDSLFQKRMVRDCELSEKRALSGKKGGKNTQKVASKFAKAKHKANSENEIEYENEVESKDEVKEKGVTWEKTWREDFEAYCDSLRDAYRQLVNDAGYLQQQQEFHPSLDIPLTLKKACVEYWATEAAWKKKKRSSTKDIDWKATLTNALNQSFNKVYKQNGAAKSNSQAEADKRTSRRAMANLAMQILSESAGEDDAGCG